MTHGHRERTRDERPREAAYELAPRLALRGPRQAIEDALHDDVKQVRAVASHEQAHAAVLHGRAVHGGIKRQGPSKRAVTQSTNVGHSIGIKQKHGVLCLFHVGFFMGGRTRALRLGTVPTQRTVGHPRLEPPGQRLQRQTPLAWAVAVAVAIQSSTTPSHTRRRARPGTAEQRNGLCAGYRNWRFGGKGEAWQTSDRFLRQGVNKQRALP